MAASHIKKLRLLFSDLSQLPEHLQDAQAAARCGDDAELFSDLVRLLEKNRRNQMLREDGFGSLESMLSEALPDEFGSRTFGPFHLDELIGSGGMGRVYRGHRTDGTVTQEVALKIVRTEAINASVLRRFSSERKLLAALNHPGICRFLDAGTALDGTPFVAMELIHGEALLDYCDRARLCIRERVQIFRKVLAAVGYAHRHLVIHRDIKSSNVLVTADGIPKLLDFGIAKTLASQDGDALTATADRFFTPCNAAPEQIKGNIEGVGCDLYQLGVMGYQLLCGKAPFDLAGLSRGEIERILLHIPPVPMARRITDEDQSLADHRGLKNPHALARQLAGDLDVIFGRCLRKDVAERYATVDELDSEIACWLERRPIKARNAETAYRARKFVSRHRLAVALTGSLALTLIGSSLALGIQSIDLNEERNRALAERNRAQQAVELLKDSFLSADPAHSAGVDVSVRQVLRAAHPKLDEQFEQQPQLFADLAGTLADVEFELGQEKSAGDLALRAADAAERSGESVERIHHLLSFGALALARSGAVAEALHALDRAHAINPHGSALEDLARGVSQRMQSEYSEALATLQLAVKRFGNSKPEQSLAVFARWQLAEAMRAENHHIEALQQLDQTLAWQRKSLPESHPTIIRTRLRRAESLRQLGRISEAIIELGVIGKDIQRLYGDRSSFTAQYHIILAFALDDAGKNEDALIEQRLALASWQSVVGELHTNSRRSALKLAQMLGATRAGREEASRLLTQVVALSEVAEGVSSNMAIYARITHARMLLRWGKAAFALDSLIPGSGAPSLGEPLMPENRKDYLDLLEASIEQAGCRATSTNARGTGMAPETLQTSCRSAAAIMNRELRVHPKSGE